MAAPTYPREGCFLGGLMTDRVTVQCRTDQDADITMEVSKYPDFRSLVGTTFPVSVTTSTHWRGTCTVTGLSEWTKYYWRIKLDNSVDAVVYGTEKTGTAGDFKTLSSDAVPWSFAHLSCYHKGSNADDTAAGDKDQIWQSVMDYKPTFMIHQDDIYYSDNGPGFPDPATGGAGNTLYGVGHWYNLDPNTPTDYSVEKYRTNFISNFSNTSSPGDQLISAGAGGSRKAPMESHSHKAHATIPCYYMWGDHDRAFDDCGGRVNYAETVIATGDELARWNAGRDAGHEMFMDLNSPLINGETGRNWVSKTTEDAYFYIDVNPMRLIVLDDCSFRTDTSAADSATKTILGVTQQAWVLDLIANNPHKFLVISLGANLAGSHGWDYDYEWGWEWSSYARKILLDAIWATGNAHRTLIISGDTHELGVIKHQGPNFDKPAIYEMFTGNSSYRSKLHGFLNNLNAGDISSGASLDGMWVNARGFSMVEHTGGRLKATMITQHQAGGAEAGGTPARVVWQRWFS